MTRHQVISRPAGTRSVVRAVIYARYSTDLQSAASIEDQVEVCRRYAVAQGWEVVGIYDDKAQSGASAFRAGLQRLMVDLDRRMFEVVVAEAVDRIGRKLADIATFHDRANFAGVKIHAVGAGEITAMHIGLLGTMAQLQLGDLREKTKRGLLGRARAGYIPGGKAYGYDIVEPEGGGQKGNRGLRRINPAEAVIVRRIYTDYAAGKGPRAIAKALNAERIPAPDGRHWNDTTIRGQRDRGTGILNNPVYVGRLEWNRTSYVKDPRTGKRVARINDASRRETFKVPALRIVEDELWQKVRTRQADTAHAMGRDEQGNALNRAHRRKFLLSGMLKCGACGGAYTIIGKDRYGCRAHRTAGTCANDRTIKRQDLEARVLADIKQHMLAPALVAEFIATYEAEEKRLARETESSTRNHAVELANINKRIAGIVKAIEDGAYTPTLKERLAELESQRLEMNAKSTRQALTFKQSANSSDRLSLVETYKRKVATLETAMAQVPIKEEAADILRSVIGQVALRPQRPDGISIHVQGEISALPDVVRLPLPDIS